MSNNDNDIKIYTPARQRKKVIDQEDVIIKSIEQELDYDKLGEMIIKETADLLGCNEISLVLKSETNNK